jgi:hypothetical protein
MKRFEKYGDTAIKTLTFPLRVLVGLSRCIEKNMPERLEFPFTIKKKEVGNGRENTNN